MIRPTGTQPNDSTIDGNNCIGAEIGLGASAGPRRACGLDEAPGSKSGFQTARGPIRSHASDYLRQGVNCKIMRSEYQARAGPRDRQMVFFHAAKKRIFDRYFASCLQEFITNQLIEIDYPVYPTPRFGYGKPPHPR